MEVNVSSLGTWWNLYGGAGLLVGNMKSSYSVIRVAVRYLHHASDLPFNRPQWLEQGGKQ